MLSQITGETSTTTLKVYVDNSAIEEAKNTYEGKITLSLYDNPKVMNEITITREEENTESYGVLFRLNIQYDYFEGTANAAFHVAI